MVVSRNEPFPLPIRILQFGEGNFLRGFIDWMVERMNAQGLFQGGVQLVQPRGQSKCAAFNAQAGLYTVILRGIDHGQVMETIERIQCVKGCLNTVTDWAEIEALACSPDLRFVVSNTTEAGIEYIEHANTFPAKIARLLQARFYAQQPGLIFLPCELIERNGEQLKACVLRYCTDAAVRAYIERACVFCNTLVDRIVSGYPGENAERYWQQLGYEDHLMVCGEPFHFMAIEAPRSVRDELPFEAAGLNVLFTDDLTPYRTRKVRLLNGAHTASVLAGHLAGFTWVDEMVRDPAFNAYLRTILFDEILPTIDLPDAEKRAFAESVLERFANPFAQHRLLSIALNSVAKWKVRILPTILDYLALYGTLPVGLTASMASLIAFYQRGPVQDVPQVVDFFATQPTVKMILARSDFWGMDLNALPDFTRQVEIKLKELEEAYGHSSR